MDRLFLAFIVFLSFCVIVSIMLHKKDNAFGYKQMDGPKFYGCKKVHEAPNKDKNIYSNARECLANYKNCSPPSPPSPPKPVMPVDPYGPFGPYQPGPVIPFTSR